MLWNATLATILATVVTESQDDLVGVWLVLRWVRSTFPQFNPDEARSASLIIIEKGLESGALSAGSFLPGSSDVFQTWGLDARASLEKIAHAWDALGREPDIGDNLWLIGRGLEYTTLR